MQYSLEHMCLHWTSAVLLAGCVEVARAQVWQLSSPLGPGDRGWVAMAHDSGRGRTVLFGGGDANGLRLGDTWEFDGQDWRPVATTLSPTARTGHALTYDRARGRIVLFGGQTSGGPLSDTWEFDGTAWISPVISRAPPQRARHALAF